MKKDVRFHDTIVAMLAERLDVLNGRSLNRATCLEFYHVIFNNLQDIFTKAEVELTNESLNWLAQGYYDSILINGRDQLDPSIFTQRAKFENISTRELVLLAGLLRGSELVYEVVSEIKRRS